MNIQLRNYETEDWEKIRNFIKLYWREDHPFLNRDLFEWQHKGYGPLATSSTTKLLFYKNDLIGFLGGIPGIFQVPMNGRINKIASVHSALWVMRPDFRNRGGGILLLREIEKLGNCLVALGANDDATRYFKSKGFNYLKALNRYIMPLEEEGYLKIISQQPNPEDLKKWINKIDLNSVSPLEPFVPRPDELESLWLKSTEELQIFTLYRKSDFWDWRYIKSKGFKYHFLGGGSRGGIVVARIEPIFSPDKPLLHSKRILRIIEMIPANRKVWDGVIDIDFVDLIKGVIKWGQTEKCIAADFQCSTNRYEKILTSIGFKKQNSDYGPPLCSLAGLFQPLKFKPRPICALWRVVEPDNTTINIPVNDTLFLKSDTDMDRPNIWPLPKSFE